VAWRRFRRWAKERERGVRPARRGVEWDKERVEGGSRRTVERRRGRRSIRKEKQRKKVKRKKKKEDEVGPLSIAFLSGNASRENDSETDDWSPTTAPSCMSTKRKGKERPASRLDEADLVKKKKVNTTTRKGREGGIVERTLLATSRASTSASRRTNAFLRPSGLRESRRRTRTRASQGGNESVFAPS
jgi:hypothetical protein